MRRLLTLLIRPHSSGWWHVDTSDKDNNVREYLFIFPALLEMVRNALNKEAADVSATDADDAPPPS